tara:strand:+ start:1979 stop:2356 length:378 start_codon:yes stop_codon:yes gene_type:complete
MKNNFINLSQRQLRVGEMVRQIISNCFQKDILNEELFLNNPITVSKVKMSRDLKIANVFIMPLGGKNLNEIIDILNLNKFVFQKELAISIKTKFTPKIIFFLDDTFIEADKINTLLSKERVKKDL